MIATTEIARAVGTASTDTWTANGVRQWEWILSPGACELCQEQEGPHEIGEDMPPLHPWCRCSGAPIDPGAAAVLAAQEESPE